MRKKFSVVLPVRNTELDLLKRNLSSWCKLDPDEMIICLDKPADKSCVDVATRMASEHNVNLRILEIEKNSDYVMHQAWVRRKGFLEAENDIILTGDIDLYVYPTCLKAIELVGENNVGLVSLSKLRNTHNFSGWLRNKLFNLAVWYAKKVGYTMAGQAYFTGLYCIYRPYWLDSEDEKSIKSMPHPYYAPITMDSWGGYRGEDTHLRDFMIKKHKCLYLPDIGAEDLRPGLEERKEIQTRMGLQFAYEGRSPGRVLMHSIIHLRPYVFLAYVKQLNEIYGAKVNGQILRSIIYQLYLILSRILRSYQITGSKVEEESSITRTGKFSLIPGEEESLEDLLQTYKHEFPVSITMKRIRGDLFVDIGANKGYYSLLLRNNFRRIIAFEPAKSSYEELINNITRFQATDKIAPIKKAVSDRDGQRILYLTRYGKYHGFVAEQLVADSGIAEKGGGEVVESQEVDTVSLGSYFANEKLIDLVKVDVEGAEWDVLKGAEPIISKIKRWIIELHDLGRRKELETWFKERGYDTKLLQYTLTTCHIFAWRD